MAVRFYLTFDGAAVQNILDNFLTPENDRLDIMSSTFGRGRDTRNSNSTEKRGISNPIGQAKSVFIFNSNMQNHFCLKPNN